MPQHPWDFPYYCIVKVVATGCQLQADTHRITIRDRYGRMGLSLQHIPIGLDEKPFQRNPRVLADSIAVMCVGTLRVPLDRLLFVISFDTH